MACNPYRLAAVLAFLSPSLALAQNFPAPTLPLTGTEVVPCIQGGGYKGCTPNNFEALAVTSVGLSLPASVFTVSGSPVTTTGTLTGSFATQSPNVVWSGPSSGGVATPTFRALVGADLPNPSSSALGGTRSIATVSHNFLTGISTSGIPSQAQPVCADLSNGAASCSTDATNASNISSGTLAAARGGAGTITGALKANGAGLVSQAACADLSNGSASCSTDTTNASNISSGTLAAARGGAGTITGALKGSGAGVVSQAACADLSNGTASCSTDTTNASNISSGTLAAARGGAGTTSGILKANGAGTVSAATSGTDYAPATSGSAILKGNGAGGFSSAASGTDYAPATSGSAILKGNGAGGFSSAASGTDYAPATSGSAILKGNAAGGFSAASAGTDYAGLTNANVWSNNQQTVSLSGANVEPLLVLNSGARSSGNAVSIKLTPGSGDSSGFYGAFDDGDALSTGLRMTVANSGGLMNAINITSGALLRFYAYTAGTLQTDGSGNVSVTSDARLKDVLRPYTRGLADLKRMGRPVIYDWKRERAQLQAEGKPINTYAGWTAQDVQKGLPEAVSTGRDGYLGLSDRAIIAAQNNAILELSARVERLERRLRHRSVH